MFEKKGGVSFISQKQTILMETYAVRNITKLRNEAPQSSDVLSDILRKGAQTLLQQAIEAEVQSYLSRINGSW